MIKALLEKLSAPKPEPLDDGDARLAITALLVRLARSDNAYGSEEIAEISNIVARRYELSPEETAILLNEAEQIEAHAPDTIRFTNAVKEAVPLEDRISVVSAAWSVVLADGVRTAEEDALMRMIPRFLGISDRESNEARIRAARVINNATS